VSPSRTSAPRRDLAGSADPQPSGDPAEHEAPEQFKSYREGFARIKEAAANRERGEVSFEFGLKSVQDDAADESPRCDRAVR
jgi:hypothetical protein